VAASSQAKKLNIMSYNVENLFDTTHDIGKLDYTYLPKSIKDTSREVQEYCQSVGVPRWKEECYNIDWTDAKLKKNFLH